MVGTEGEKGEGAEEEGTEHSYSSTVVVKTLVKKIREVKFLCSVEYRVNVVNSQKVGKSYQQFSQPAFGKQHCLFSSLASIQQHQPVRLPYTVDKLRFNTQPCVQ